jgi:hypothetical protein
LSEEKNQKNVFYAFGVKINKSVLTKIYKKIYNLIYKDKDDSATYILIDGGYREG